LLAAGNTNIYCGCSVAVVVVRRPPPTSAMRSLSVVAPSPAKTKILGAGGVQNAGKPKIFVDDIINHRHRHTISPHPGEIYGYGDGAMRI
jgi:hypothetical protein